MILKQEQHVLVVVVLLLLVVVVPVVEEVLLVEVVLELIVVDVVGQKYGRSSCGRRSSQYRLRKVEGAVTTLNQGALAC